MRLKIPLQKDQRFSSELFTSLSDGLTDLKIENGKWPDRIVFHGKLGKEVFDHLTEKEWDLKQFNPTHTSNAVDKIVIDYSKPLTQIEERGGTIFDEALSTKKVNGIPDTKTMAKIQTAYSNLAYTIERSVRPSYAIKLFRQK